MKFWVWLISFLEFLLHAKAPKVSLPKAAIGNDNILEPMTDMAFQNPLSPTIWAIICDVSSRMNIDSALVASVVMTESAGNPWASRYEPGWKYIFKSSEFARSINSSVATEQMLQSTSFGLMQVMGTVARERGHKGWLTELCDPKIGLEFGILHLKAKIKQFGDEPGIAAYNSGTPRKNDDGTLVNQDYVDKVKAFRGGFLCVTKISMI